MKSATGVAWGTREREATHVNTESDRGENSKTDQAKEERKVVFLPGRNPITKEVELDEGRKGLEE